MSNCGQSTGIKHPEPVAEMELYECTECGDFREQLGFVFDDGEILICEECA